MSNEDKVIFFDEDGKISVEVLATHLREHLSALEGRDPETKKWTPGRWSGYTSYYPDKPDQFLMENEDDGGSVSIQVTEDYDDNICVLVTKKYIINTSDNERGWSQRNGCEWPNARDKVSAILVHVSDLHGKGPTSLHMDQQNTEVEDLKKEIERQKGIIQNLRERASEQRDEGWY